MGQFIETWRGEAVNWECDELGHLNMRHYRSKATQAMQMLVLHLGLSGAFKPGAVSSVATRHFTVRYLKETAPGQPMYIETGILKVKKSSMQLIHMIYHQTGDLSATVQETVDHISLRTQTPFPWPERVLKSAKKFRVELPKDAQPRGIPDLGKAKGPNERALKKLGAHKIGAGMFRPAAANVFGHITTQDILGRCSETVSSMTEGFPELQDFYKEDNTLGAVLLEIRVYIHKRPSPGDGYTFYSGLISASENVRQFTHHMVDPVTGKSWASVIAVNCLFDLAKRRHVKTSTARLAELNNVIVEGLTA